MPDGQKGTFGRGLQKFIQNNLPYRSPASIIDDVTLENPKFKDFYKAISIIDLIYLILTILSLVSCYKKGFILIFP